MPASISIAHRAPAPSPERHGRATLLAPDFAERDVCRRTLADAGLGLAVAVETPASWLAALWELWGDGRQLVDAAARKLLLAEVLYRHTEGAPGEGGLRESAGTVDMLARAARGYLPYALAADAAGSFTASSSRQRPQYCSRGASATGGCPQASVLLPCAARPSFPCT